MMNASFIADTSIVSFLENVIYQSIEYSLSQFLSKNSVYRR